MAVSDLIRFPRGQLSLGAGDLVQVTNVSIYPCSDMLAADLIEFRAKKVCSLVGCIAFSIGEEYDDETSNKQPNTDVVFSAGGGDTCLGVGHRKP